MKTLKLYLALLIFAAFAISCSKDDDKPSVPVFQEENTYQLMMDKAAFNSITPQLGGTNLEAGFLFKPLTKGKMTTLIVKIPAADPNLVVNIWDMTNGNLIKSEVMNIPTASVVTTMAITPIALETTIEYAITVRSTNVYENKRVGSDPIAFPFNCANIQVTNYGVSTANSFPTPGGNIYYGNVGFKFIQML